MTLAVGTRLGPYEILSALGSGGMGEVYRARDTRLGREIAIKVLPSGFATDPERMRRFEDEARTASSLNHPNVVTIHDVGREEGTAFIAMELVEGESLRERLAGGPMTPEHAAGMAAQIADGLARAHAAGIVHRDLKPENVMITGSGIVKILDFGLARNDVATGSSEAETVSMRTADGSVLGTIGYMAPEQARGARADARSDIFSFGAILYEMVAGRRAFSGETAVATLAAIVSAEPPDFSGLSGVPAALAAIVRRCLEKDPERRFSSAHDIALQLRDFSSKPAAAARPARARKKAIDSVAVLPFTGTGEGTPDQYLGDGVTESIIHGLSELPKLHVMAASTVFRYRDREPQEAGRALGVRAVLTGRLTHAGDAVRVQAELVDTETGFRLWGGVYDRRMADLLSVQDEIAREICNHLRFKLSGAERRRVAKAPTRNPEAYQAYLKGRFFWNKWTTEGMKTALDFYQKAIEIDPTYALAWAGIADAWSAIGGIKAVPPAEAFPKAKAAALRALELDPALSDAHASLAYVRRLFDWDWPGAEAAFREAVRLNPSYAEGHRWYGQFLSGIARHDEAVREATRALELDPLSIIIHTAVGDVLFYARRYREAIGYYRKALAMDPEFQAGHSDLARALEFGGPVEEAIREYEAAVRLAGRTETEADPSIGLANAYAVAGRREDALRVLEELKRWRSERYVSPWGLASIYARLGEDAQALDWLERAYAEHDSTLVWLKVHPRFDAIRGHPRFAALLSRMNLV